MKKYFLYTLAVLSLSAGLSSCDNFGNVNDDPEHLNNGNIDPKLIFTQVQSQISGSDSDIWGTALIYSANMILHTASPNWSQGTFYTQSYGYNSAYWDSYYSGDRAAIRNIIDVITRWQKSPNTNTEVQYARILKAYMFQVMTDLYGDVPYSEAGLATSGIGYPKYDKQKDIYAAILNELEEVNTELTGAANSVILSNADIMYGGNTESWRKFGNSLMLRVAMRLSKVDPATASQWAKLAVKNGVFTQVEESAKVPHVGSIISNDSAEPYAKILASRDPEAFFLSEYFINELKSSSDPRIHLLATKCENLKPTWSTPNFDFGNSDNIDALIGLRSGYEDAAGDWDVKNMPGFPVGDKNWRTHYAVINRQTLANPEAPSMLLTHGQTQLLLADAAARGFIDGGNSAAKAYFKQGLEASMEQFKLYPAAKASYNTYLTGSKLTDFITQRLAAFDANPLEEINWHYYVVSLGNEYEAFSNWRRSGYPALKPVYEAPYNVKKYPLSVTDQIPRRFTYPTDETQSNSAHYAEAVKSLDQGDAMASRVWWDVKN